MSSLKLSASFAALLLSACVQAHTRVWSVYLNGVDMGTGVAVRDPVPEGPAPDGFNNWPMRNVTSLDMQCHVLGYLQDPNTIDVLPGDILTFDFHHNDRTSDDDIIASSHIGPCQIYLSPDPPGPNSWVKIWEQGENPPHVWCTTGSLTAAAGKLNARIPYGLAPGTYLIRPELIALHEANTQWVSDNDRGAQFYFECIQLRVLGTGTVTLPPGVSFPGVYSETDPGIWYNVYTTTQGQSYVIPGPTVWSGAAPSPSAPAFGAPVGDLSMPATWNTWVNGYTYTTTITEINNGATTTFLETPTWSTAYMTPTGSYVGSTGLTFTTTTTTTTTIPKTTPPPTTTTRSMSTSTTTTTPPSMTTTTTMKPTTTTTTTTAVGPQATHYGQCGGIGWTGATVCASPYTCKVSNSYYSQCL